MKYAVIGSRHIADIDWICSVLDKYDISLIVSGGAKGVDTIAANYCKHILGIEPLVIRPEYDKYPSHVAPMVRNTAIIENCDEVIAIHDGKSTGTLDAIKKARKLGKPVFLFNPNDENGVL